MPLDSHAAAAVEPYCGRRNCEVVRTADPDRRLSSLREGGAACIRAVTCPFQGLRLREIGICEGHVVEVLQAGDPMICRVGACRMGICRHLAEHVVLACDPVPVEALASPATAMRNPQ